MNSTLNVHLFCSPIAHASHAAVFASLPGTYTLNAEGPVDVAVADENPANIAAASDAMPGALVIENPGQLSKAQAQALADGTIPVFPLFRLSSALSQVGPASLPQAAILVRSHLSWQGSMVGAVIEHIMALGEALGSLSDPQLVQTEQVYAARARTGVCEVAWSGQAGAIASRYELDIVGLDARLEVFADLTEVGNPIRVRSGSAQGFRQPQGAYESHLRLFWRNLALDRSHASAVTKMSRLLDAIALLSATPPASRSS